MGYQIWALKPDKRSKTKIDSEVAWQPNRNAAEVTKARLRQEGYENVYILEDDNDAN